ncbi:MAG: class GN sortase [Pseudomonadales bacterium]
MFSVLEFNPLRQMLRGSATARRSAMYHGMSVLLLTLSLSQAFDGAWIHAKATVAQLLIANAWSDVREGQGSVSKPWPWADTWPVARIQYNGDTPRDLYVLAGAQGNSLAFGPGHLFGSALPGETGVSIVGGHRDTHFAFLQHANIGDALVVTPASGETRRYVITDKAIANSLTDPLLAMPYSSQLMLVTCYPFDAVQSGPLRYVVTAELQNVDQQETML